MGRLLHFSLALALILSQILSPLSVSAAKESQEKQKKPSLEQRLADLETNFSKKNKELEKRITELLEEIKNLQNSLKNLVGKNDEKKSKVSSEKTPKKTDVKQERQQSQDELMTTAVERVSPAVVSIVISKDVPELEVVYQNPFGDDPLFKDFDLQIPVYRKKGMAYQKIGAGTGFIISSDGYIVTNKHVVSDMAADYTVLLTDASQQKAKVYYRDPVYDLALIKIDGGPYPVVKLENSDRTKLGQTVLAIGNALGEYDNSISVGIVSGLNRKLSATDDQGRVEELSNVFQTDAAINLGNSGGPLIDLNGNAVGVNVAKRLDSENIGFAIPINRVRDVVSLALGRSLPVSSVRQDTTYRQ